MNITLGAAATTSKSVIEAATCEHCGNPMEPKRTHGGRQKRFCGNQCKKGARYKRKREAVLAYRREYRARNAEAVIVYQREHYVRNREYLAKLKDRPCTDCGRQLDKRLMEFDHVPERGPKLFAVSQCSGRSRAIIDAEIAKCELVCRDCHARRTEMRGQSGWRKRKAAAA